MRLHRKKLNIFSPLYVELGVLLQIKYDGLICMLNDLEFGIMNKFS